MSQIILGKNGDRNVTLDLDALLRGRMLVQANSGKGKSWLLRRLAEQLFGKVQVIIIDPEGEFATLREKYGYVLVGKGGETPADPRSTALVAHKLLELRASAVCDLYEMKPSARHEWVQRFLDAMIDAPKNLWHPCLVMIDEAHVYCPEKGAGESVASEAVIGLGTRGRKRGFAIVAATQRLGKLRKDLAAELLNVMIGGTFIDIDRKRAADALGVYGAEQHKFFDEIKVLDRGHFYALGPAISNERILVSIGPVGTSHPEAGSAKHAAEPPPAPDKVRALLPKLTDLPKAAEEKARTEADLRREIRDLKAELRSAGAQKPQLSTERLIVDSRAIAVALKPWKRAIADRDKLIADRDRHLNAVLKALSRELEHLSGIHFPAPTEIPDGEIQQGGVGDRATNMARDNTSGAAPERHPRPDPAPDSNGDQNLTPYQRDILRGLAELASIGRTEVAPSIAGAAAAKSHKSSTFERYLAALRKAGLIEYRNGKIAMTSEGARFAPPPREPLSSEEIQQRSLGLLTPYQQDILRAAIGAYPETLTREDLASRAGKTHLSSTFERYLAALRSAEMIVYATGGVKAADWLFLDL